MRHREKLAAAFFLPLVFAACAGPARYQCPEPVGVIVRDDCEAYRTRYEATRVDLSAGISKFAVDTSIRQEALRDPSELVQVMSARMVALCHDFNACRLTPAEYSKKREEIDRTMTAIAAIGQQLNRPGLSADERKKLLERLTDLLAPPQSQAAPGKQARTPPGRPPGPKKRRVAGSLPWLGSRMLPPMNPVPDGFPRLLARWSARALEHVWVPKSPDKPHHKKIGGWMLRTGIHLHGNLAADDRVEIRLADGRSYGCPVRRNMPDGGYVRCRPPKGFLLDGSEFSAEVIYRRAATGERKSIGRLYRKVKKSFSGGYCVDHDDEVGRAWLYFLPEPPYLPAEFERPYLRVTLRLRRYEKAVARCFAGEKPVTGAIRPSRFSGESGTCQDRPRYVKVDEHSSRSEPHPFIKWRHYDFALPFVVPAVGSGAKSLPEGLSAWPPATGRWKCVVKVGAEPVREVYFEVKDDGRLEPLPEQVRLDTPWWLLRARVLPNRVEDLDGWNAGGRS